MSTQATLGHDHRAFVRVEPSGLISASGMLVPRLMVELKLSTPRETVVAEIHHLRLQVKFQNEVIGEGSAVGDVVNSIERRMSVEVPVTRTALEFVNERLEGDRVDLMLGLKGWMRIRHELEDDGQPIHLGSADTTTVFWHTWRTNRSAGAQSSLDPCMRACSATERISRCLEALTATADTSPSAPLREHSRKLAQPTWSNPDSPQDQRTGAATRPATAPA